jgi:hypothetical protein
MTQLAFLQHEWAVFEAASKVEAAVHADPRSALLLRPSRLVTGGQLDIRASRGARRG